jgi:hypothetical protein
MEQQALNAADAVEKAASDERREPPAPALIPGWRCVPQAKIRAHGEEGFVDLAALNPTRGVALVALLEPDEEASPEEARAALRSMLEEEGFEQRFPGELPVVALTQRRAEADQLATAVETAFDALPRPDVTEDWVDWLAERLAPKPAAAEPSRPRLVAPPRDEAAPERVAEVLLLAPPRDEPAPPPAEAITAPADAPPQSAAPPARQSWLDWGASFGFAVGVVLVLLVALALLSHSGRLF